MGQLLGNFKHFSSKLDLTFSSSSTTFQIAQQFFFMKWNCPTDGDHPRDGDHPDDFPYSLITILTLLAILETTLAVPAVWIGF